MGQIEMELCSNDGEIQGGNCAVPNLWFTLNVY